MGDVTVVVVPQWQGSGADGARVLARGAESLAGALPEAEVVRVAVPDEGGFARDGVRSLDVVAEVARRVRAVLGVRGELGGVVVTAGGDCGVEAGSVGAAAERFGDRLAVVWFDAHADLNTPGSSPSGAFHGMVLRTLLGDGPGEVVPAVPVRAERLVLAGVRALDEAERAFIAERGVRHLPVAEVLAAPDSVAEAVAATGASAVYVHVDLDVLDPGLFGSLSVPEPGGLTPDALVAAVRAVTARFDLAGIGITEYAPARPQDQDTLARIVHGFLG